MTIEKLGPQNLQALLRQKLEERLEEEFGRIGAIEPQGRAPASREVSNARRVLANNDVDAMRLRDSLGQGPKKAQSIADVREMLTEMGLPVGKDPARLDDPVTKKSLQKAAGKEAAAEFLGGDLSLEALLGILEAKEANRKPPPPRPRPAPSQPSRGMSSPAGASDSSGASSSGGASPAGVSPAGASSTAPKKPAVRDPDAAGGKVVTVKEPTTVNALAEKHNVNPAVLIAANPKLANAPDGKIAAGEKVFVPKVDGKADPMATFTGKATGDVKGDVKGAERGKAAQGSPEAQKQMADLLATAKANAEGKRPAGMCLKAVQDYIDQSPYGAEKVPRLPEARNFAEHLNQGNNAEKMGFEKLDIDNPYDAPPGAIVVVRAGTPGTSHPTAGDIVVKGEGDKFYNDGEMGYGGPQNFPKGNDFVLGVYVPKGGAAGAKLAAGGAAADAGGSPGGVPPPVKQGDKGADVERLQAKLAERGFDAGKSGTFDTQTQRAVAAFNQSQGIEGGAASKATQAALNPLSSLYAKGEKERTHEVKAGDTVDSIAQKNNVSVALLRQANPALEKQSTLQEGQKLTLPGVNLEKAPQGAYDAAAAARDPTSTMGTDTPKAAGAVPPLEHSNAKLEPLGPGDEGRKVSELQAQLKQRGLQAGADGKYDAKTAAAVAKFNEAQGLPGGERASVETVRALNPTVALLGKKAAPVADSGAVDAANWKPGPGDVTPKDLQQIVPGLTDEKAAEVAPHLNQAMAEAKINTPERKAQFIAQLAHESGGFMYDEEIASGAAYEGRADLGNTQPGDGERFKGRGFIQVTGRANYEAAGKALGLDLVNHPELASLPQNASRIAAWYWSSRDINQIADRGDVVGVTQAINGGENGLADRQAYYARAQSALA